MYAVVSPAGGSRVVRVAEEEEDVRQPGSNQEVMMLQWCCWCQSSLTSHTHTHTVTLLPLHLPLSLSLSPLCVCVCLAQLHALSLLPLLLLLYVVAAQLSSSSSVWDCDIIIVRLSAHRRVLHKRLVMIQLVLIKDYGKAAEAASHCVSVVWSSGSVCQSIVNILLLIFLPSVVLQRWQIEIELNLIRKNSWNRFKLEL